MTVLITGASQGIGEALAYCYARKGHKLVLVARNSEKLNNVAAKCQQLSQQTVMVLIVDLSFENAVETILQALQKQQIEITVLINNAGFGIWGPFVEQPFAALLQMTQVHVNALLQLTQALLPNMLQNKSGQIINIGSLYSFIPVPEQAVYAATKAFLLSFSESLAYELKNTGVNVLLVCPGATETQFRKRGGIHSNRKLSMTADQVAQLTYQAALQKRSLLIPGVKNQLFISIVTKLPRKIASAMIQWINHSVRAIRKPPLNSA